ncbi:hypothetical protein [Sorangium sp. So ce542]|uniref:hypothetical protein n=1 Tax=Sorangium sp. So ce542 TaxID=3133316 RepID=UPI003F5FF21D
MQGASLSRQRRQQRFQRLDRRWGERGVSEGFALPRRNLRRQRLSRALVKEALVMVEAFHMGGWGMYPTLVFGPLLLAASVRYAVSPERRFVPLQVSLGILTLVSGGLGFVSGTIKSLTLMGAVPPDARWLWIVGLGESLNNVALALALLILSALAATVGAYRISQTSPAR